MPRVQGRVAHLSTAHPARDNRIFHKECRALQEAGIDVWLIIPQVGDENAEGVMVHGLPRRESRMKRMIWGQLDAWRALNKVQPSLVHFHDPELIPLVFLWKVIRRRKAIYDAHEDLEKQIEGKTYLPRWARSASRRLARVLTWLADLTMNAVVAATPHIAARFRNKNTIIVHNFPWLSEFTNSSGNPHEPGTMVYVGGISEARGYSSMISIAHKIPKARLLIAGSMDDEVSKLFTRLPDTSPVEYLGKLPANEVPTVIERGAVGLVLLQPLPNYVESLPTKLFEYMASGIPFVATNFRYWRDLLETFQCGVFVDVNDEDSCVQALSDLLRNPEECARMGARGRAAVEGRFNFDGDAKLLVVVTRSLLRDAAVEAQESGGGPGRSRHRD